MERSFAAGDYVFKPGEPSDKAFEIVSGEVEILTAPDGVRLAVFHAGEIFGEMGLIDERPRQLAARATRDTVLLSLTKDAFMRMVLDDPQQGLKYLRVLFERLRQTNAKVLGQMPTNERPAITPKPLAGGYLTIFLSGVRSDPEVPPTGLQIHKFPFRIGRMGDKGEKDPLGVNDLYIADHSPYQVSRNHLVFDKTEQGIIVRDRGSYLGTYVNGEKIGGNRKRADLVLTPGENIVTLGNELSSFKIRVLVSG